MKYLVYNQGGELVARCEYLTVAALLVLALSDGFGDGASIRTAKNLKSEIFVYKHKGNYQSAAVIASRAGENEKLLPGYRVAVSWSAAQQQTADDASKAARNAELDRQERDRIPVKA